MSSNIKFSLIYDNRNHEEEKLKGGWGFSCFIEWKDRKILFDTGGESEAFFSNCEKLKIPFELITHLIFSHQHWDHTAGFKEVLNRLGQQTAVYLPKSFSNKLLKQTQRVNEFKIIDSFFKIDEGIYWKCNKRGAFFLIFC